MTAPGLAFERVRRESLARPQVPGTALPGRESLGLPCPAAMIPEVTKKPHRPGLAVQPSEAPLETVRHLTTPTPRPAPQCVIA